MYLLQRIAAALPSRWQYELKRLHYRRLIRLDRFVSEEPEFRKLQELVSVGDWVIDIGANVGHYTKLLSDLVGPRGRVISLEPVPETLSLLAANMRYFQNANVTLINAAASDATRLVTMEIPDFNSGMKNYYQAHIMNEGSGLGELSILTIGLDSMDIPQRVSLVKIDAEGHEYGVLKGMEGLLRRDHPILVVEGDSEKVMTFLSGIGYRAEKLPKSPNILFRVEAT